MSGIEEFFEKSVDAGLIPQIPMNYDVTAYKIYTGYLENKIDELTAENAELRARLDKAVDLPVNIGGKIWEIFDNTLIFERNVYHIGLSENRTTFRLTGESGLFYLGEVELTDYKKTWFTDRAEAEARLKEIQKEDEE